MLFAGDQRKAEKERERERGPREQINHEFMPLFAFSFCAPILHPCWHDGAFPRRAIIKTLGAATPRDPTLPVASSTVLVAGLRAVVARSHKEAILASRFIRSKVYAGFTPPTVDENRRA